MNRNKYQILAGLLVAALAFYVNGQSLMAQEEIPDTPAGTRLAGLLDALDKQGDTLESFFADGFEDQSEAAFEHRLAQSRMVLNEFGKFQFDKVVSSSNTEISARCKTANGPIAVLSITVSADEPHRITGIGVEISDGDEEVGEDHSPLDVEEKRATIERLINELNSKYVFPEVAEKMSASLQESLDQNAYEDVTEPGQFASMLTDQLLEICKDKHLRVRSGRPRAPSTTPGRRLVDNHGFVKAEMLGSVGYLKFNYFSGDQAAEKTAAAAMNFLANSEAIIFDLRNNGGGSVEMIAFLSGYLFDESVHLNSFYNRPSDTTSESWSRDDVPGDRFGNTKPVFVLTSDYTFSGAEEFSYNLKHLKRATLVGETTGGGAHPVRPVRLGKRFHMSMPFARAINPITNTNWEGVGVEPHVKVDAEDALDKAVELANKAIAESKVVEQPEQSVEEMIQDAMAATQSGDFAEGAKGFQQVIGSQPDDGNAWFYLGYCLHMDGKIDEAIVAHKKAIELKGNEAVATYNLACAYSLKNDVENAIATLKLAIERGMRDHGQVAGDSDFDNIRETAEFKELLETIK